MLPNFLATAVLAAEILAIKTDNAEAFDSYLAIVKNSPDGEAEISPENQLEKRKAEALSARARAIFRVAPAETALVARGPAEQSPLGLDGIVRVVTLQHYANRPPYPQSTRSPG